MDIAKKQGTVKMATPIQTPLSPQDIAVYIGGTAGVGVGVTAAAWLPLINSVLGLILMLLSIAAMGLTVRSRWRARPPKAGGK